MTSAWQSALTLLRRPATPAPLPDNPKAGRGRMPTTSSWEQAESEILAAWKNMQAERDAATTSIRTHGARREALLLQPDTDDALLKLGLEIDRASATIERLDTVQPMILERLGEIRTKARDARFIALRDRMAAKFEAFADIEEEYDARRQECLDLAAEFVNEFWDSVYIHHPDKAPDPWAILPQMAKRLEFTQTFREQLDAFKATVLQPKAPEIPAHVVMVSLADHIEVARRTGQIREDCPVPWRAEVERYLKPSLTVELTATYIDGEGRTWNKGSVLEMPTDEAIERVRIGRAIYRD